MKRRLTILIIILAFGTVLFLMLHRDTPRLPDKTLVLPIRELSIKNKVADAGPALAPIIPLAGHDLDPEPEEPSLEPPEVSPPEPDILEPGSIPGEYVLSFNNKKDLLTFLTLASMHGIEILDVTDFGHRVRLRVKNRVVLDDLLKESPTPADFGPNYFVYAPDPPEQHPLAPQTGYMGFGNRALEWLGVPSDHATWGTGVTVAVLDSGVASHPALAEQNISRKSLLNGETTGLAQYGSHGTSVASIIAGTSPDLSGVAPGANILSIQVLSSEGVGDTFTLAEGVVAAVDQGAQVLNLSLGTVGDSFMLHDAVNYALEHGVAVVAATGNDALESLLYPARYKGVLAVAGIDARSEHLYFSNRGAEIDIAAPGIAVNAALLGDDIGSFSGTSAAVPFVSGAMAWLMADNPDMTATEAAEVLLAYTNDVGKPGQDDKTGYGVLDIGRMLERNRGGIYDVALVRPYINPSEVENETTFGVVVFAQNRGTELLDSIELEVSIEGTYYRQTFCNMAVGEIISQEFVLNKDNIHMSGQITISSSITLDGAKDVRPNNNQSNLVIALKDPSVPNPEN
jgi:hypothetical protein